MTRRLIALRPKPHPNAPASPIVTVKTGKFCRMGGGFGGKESQGNALAVACAVAAHGAPAAPCKMRYDRDDDMIITGKRHDFRIDQLPGGRG